MYQKDALAKPFKKGSGGMYAPKGMSSLTQKRQTVSRRPIGIAAQFPVKPTLATIAFWATWNIARRNHNPEFLSSTALGIKPAG